MSSHVIIVGAGVIVAASALTLLNDGHKVTLVDKERRCAGASFDNAGAIVNGSRIPTAMQGILFDAIRMLAQANSAFSSKTNKAIYAFGHQHLGLTLGAITGLLISDLLSNRTPRVPIFPYRPNRFN